MSKSQDAWRRVKARDLKVGDRVIRNVELGFEWVPGPYGAFVIDRITAAGDEFRFVASESWGNAAAGAKTVKFSYDGDEEVTVG